MRRATQLAKGFGALFVLVALMIGVPWALWHFVGWPLPHAIPTWTQLHSGLSQHGIPDETLINALAIVVWLCWAVLVASLLAELPAAIGGHAARRLPVAGIFQPVTGRLLAIVVVAILATVARPGPSVTSPLPSSIHGAVRPVPVAAVLTSDHQSVSTPSVGTRPVSTPLSDTPLVPQCDSASPVQLVPPAPPVAPAVAMDSAMDDHGSAMQVYVVQPRDTLWGIAETQLSDPMRWSEIFALNEGRSEPNGQTLTDPHWIYPGWTLLLPDAAPQLPAPQLATPQSTTPQPTAPSVTQPAPVTAPLSPPESPVSPAASVPPPRTNGIPAPDRAQPMPHDARDHGQSAGPGVLPAASSRGMSPTIDLASGSQVGGSFAAGVLAAVALGRLRRRHRYRAGDPEPGRDLRPPTLGPTLNKLVRSATMESDPDESLSDSAAHRPGPEQEPPTPHLTPATALSGSVADHPVADPDALRRLEIGTRDGEPVVVDLPALGGLSMSGLSLGGSSQDGPGLGDTSVEDIGRAWCAALITKAGLGGAEILTTEAIGGRLFPQLAPTSAIQNVKGAAALLRTVEAELMGRTRRLFDAEADDAPAYRRIHPEDPLPSLLVVTDPVPGALSVRWRAALVQAARLDVAVVVVVASRDDEETVVGARITVDDTRTVSAASPEALADRVRGAQLFGLHDVEATELLTAVTSSRDDPVEEDEEEVELGAVVQTKIDGFEPASSEPWPEGVLASSANERPIEIRLLGPYGLAVRGELVTKGLRSAAKELLAWFALRPDGASAEAAIEALWPDSEPDLVTKRFWWALGNLRPVLRTAADDPNIEVLVRSGEIYRPETAVLDCDLWRFEHHLAEASRGRVQRSGACRPPPRR